MADEWLPYCGDCLKFLKPKKVEQEWHISEFKEELLKEFWTEEEGKLAMSRNAFLEQVVEQSVRLKRVVRSQTRTKGLGGKYFKSAVSELLKEFDERWEGGKLLQQEGKAVSFQQLMAMNQDTSSARVPKDKISIHSDSDYWESEFRNTHTMEKYKPQPSINVATPPQTEKENGTSSEEKEPLKAQKRPKDPLLTKQIFSHSSSAPDVLLQMIDDFIHTFDPLEVLRADFDTLPIRIGAGDLQSAQLLKIYQDFSAPMCQVALTSKLQFKISINFHQKRTELLPENLNENPWSQARQAQSEKIKAQEDTQFLLIKEDDQIKIAKTPTPDPIFQPVISLDRLREKASANVYHSLTSFIEDVKFLFSHVYQTRCQNALAKWYLWRCVVRFAKLIAKYKTDFTNLKAKDLDNILRVLPNEWKFKDPGDKYYRTIPPRRHFEKIDSFIPAAEKDLEVMKDKLRTQKHTHCEGNCCGDYKALGEISASGEGWVANCACRSHQMECNLLCHDEKCANMNLGNQEYRELGDDLRAVPCWGLDKHLFRVMFYLFPETVPEAPRIHFLEKTFNRALQLQGQKGWNPLATLVYIKQNASGLTSVERAKWLMINAEKEEFSIDRKEFTKEEGIYASILIDGIQVAGGPSLFKIYSKGIGVICTSKEGISKNTLISPYFGQIYPPWRWYEKQDIIKKGQKEGRLSSQLADFYNIMLDRHRDDPDGFDVLFVDPIIKGSFVSRLSHSCAPNCSTVVMIANQQYTIGMYAIKDIEFGEELTFDYNSVTESEEEWRSAVCLCGTSFCRGSFLGYSSFNNHQLVLQADHKFLE